MTNQDQEGMRLLKLGTVLVASDLEATSDVALSSGHALARIAGASLTLLHVGPTGNGPDDNALAAALLRAAVREGDLSVERAAGAPVPAIHTVAHRVAADVIVMGPHRHRGRGTDAAPLGSTGYGVVAGAKVPCLVLAEPLRLPLRRVLVPIDLSETARGALMVALTWASALRSRDFARLTVLHVEDDRRAREDADSADRIQGELDLLSLYGGTWAGVSVEAVTASGADVAHAIADHATDHDLIVLGTRGLGLDEAGGLGSVAAALLDRIDVPMLLVPPAVWRAYSAGQAATGRV
jgi:nucleotide-binding universal stress UspA family protein